MAAHSGTGFYGSLPQMENPAQVTAFGWEQADVTAVQAAVNAFLAAWTAYKEDNSTAKRIESREAAKLKAAGKAGGKFYLVSVYKVAILTRNEAVKTLML